MAFEWDLGRQVDGWGRATRKRRVGPKVWKQKTSHLLGTMSDSTWQVVWLVVLGSSEKEAWPLPVSRRAYEAGCSVGLGAGRWGSTGRCTRNETEVNAGPRQRQV